jgi:hypothetical protein
MEIRSLAISEVRKMGQKYLVTGNGIKVLEQAIRASENSKT